tara:strand:+ start:1809 stop:3569 length:1761 start_codon:yes stop_codon:yes gene_type:complete
MVAGLCLLVLIDCTAPATLCDDQIACSPGFVCQSGFCVAIQEEPSSEPAPEPTKPEPIKSEPQPEPTKPEPRPEPSVEPVVEPIAEKKDEPTRDVRDAGEPGKPDFSEAVVDTFTESAQESTPDTSTEPLPEKATESVPEQVAEKTPDVAPLPQLPTWSDNPCQVLNGVSPGYGGVVSKWQAQDKLAPARKDSLLVIGSSSIRLWRTLQKELAAWPIIHRGFGGSRLLDVAAHAEKIVLPYKPKAILIYAGTNDIAAGKSPTVVYDVYRCLIEKVKKGIGDIPIMFIGVTPNPARWAKWSDSVKLNGAVRQLSAAWSGLTYIDIPATFLKMGQPPSASLFVSDRLHLNVVGYTVWNMVIKPVVQAVVSTTPYTVPSSQPASKSQVLIDFGPGDTDDGNPTKSPDSYNRYWNNWHKVNGGAGLLPGETLALHTTTNQKTPWRVTLAGAMTTNGIKNGGLLAPKTSLLGKYAIATATQDFFYAGAAGSGLVVTGLDPSKTYTLTLFGSRDWGSETRVTRYEVSGAKTTSASLTTSGKGIGANGTYSGNEKSLAVVKSVKPDQWGKLHIELVTEKGSFSYLSLLSLEVD